MENFPGGPVVKNSPTNARNMGSILVWKIPHDVGQLSSCTTTAESACSRACALQREKATAMSLHTATTEYPAHAPKKTQSSQIKKKKEFMESPEENKKDTSVLRSKT